jgi:AcrR family transcriptional regulator
MTERRRSPRQERSRATHEAIVEAAARLFAESGLAATTTARIARVAGVSPGSMYHYFPSKEALVAAVFERESSRHLAAFAELAEHQGTEDPRALIRAFVSWSLDDYEANRALYRVLFQELPVVGGLRATQAVDHAAAQSLRQLLEVGRGLCQARDLDMASLLVVRAFRYCLIPFVDDEALGDARRAALVEELTDMIASYLLSPRPWHR